jgi:hypothetical protein
MSTTNSDEPWRPLSIREAEDGAQDYDALHLGVPGWLSASLWEWVERQPGEMGTGIGASGSLLREIERKLRFHLGWNGGDATAGWALLGDRASSLGLTLDVADFLVARYLEPNLRQLDELERILTEAGSGYTVQRQTRPFGLMRRVDPTVELAARSVMSREDAPGRLLARAWNAIYGLHPDPSDGYRHAVRAVEAAAIPVVLPGDSEATLGRVIGAVRGQPHLWQVTLTHRDDPQQPVNALIEMMTALWRSQYDRHVDLSSGAPLHVSQEQAETALHLAVTLVQWFTSGRVSRRP